MKANVFLLLRCLRFKCICVNIYCDDDYYFMIFTVVIVGRKLHRTEYFCITTRE